MVVESNPPNHETRRREFSFIIAIILLIIYFYIFQGGAWRGNTALHTIMEVIASILALMIGIIELLHHYAKRETTMLFLGTAFVGTGLLDGYHALVTSIWFANINPSRPDSHVPWSWIASRLY